MEGQGKRLMIAVGLALAVMLGYNMLFPQKDAPKKPAVTAMGSGSAAGSGGATTPGAPVTGPAGTTRPVGCTGGQSFTLHHPRFDATFNECGAALTGWHLTAERLQGDATKGELLAAGQPDAGAFLVSFPGSTADVAHTEKWTVGKHDETVIEFTLETPYLKLVKTFTVIPDAFVVRMQLATTALKTPSTQLLAVSVHEWQDPKADLKGSSRVQARAWSSSTLRAGGEQSLETNLIDLKVSSRREANIVWTGYEQPYLLAAFAPKRDGKVVSKMTYAMPSGPGQWADGLMRTDILFPADQIAVGATVTHEVAGYLGPKNYNALKLAETAAGFSTGFSSTVDFGWFGIIGRPLLWLLTEIYKLVGNWGIAIMLLTLLVKLVTLYPMTTSQRSMKAMAALGPQMKVLQEKYKDDKQRQQVETMALYKQHSISPIAGCLPMFMQMPVWIALYRMLSNAGELYRAPFIPGWISDLTAPDPYHILPAVLLVTMFAQARLQPQTAQGSQQKMLQYGMPLMFGVMSFFFPAGLTLYIFTNTVLSAMHSLWMNKYDKKSKEIAARIAATAPATPATAGDPKKKTIDVEAVEKKTDSDDVSRPKRPKNNPKKRGR